jgi:transposase
LLVFERGVSTWQLGFTTGSAQRPRERSVTAGNVQAVLEEITRAKRRFGLADEVRVVSCDEAGRDGLWLQRVWVAPSLETLVVDSAIMAGEQKVGRVVRVPSAEDEDRRQLHRARVTNRIQGLLAGYGVRIALRGEV